MPQKNVLVVDDEPGVCRFFERLLGKKENIKLSFAYHGAVALEHMSAAKYDLALVDLKLPDTCGLDLLREIKKLQPECEVIIMTAFSTTRTAVKAIQLGAYNFLEKPFENIDDLEAMVDEVLSPAGSGGEGGLAPWEKLAGSVGLVVGQNPQMQRLISTAYKIAGKDVNVLIHGETGTGKEVLARFIHAASKRSDKNFFAINCGAFPENLLESELFGHEKGAFTGAVNTRRGIFELADKGTLFLDEIGEASLAIQVKLLRVLESGEFVRVGGEKPMVSNVRIIAATNRDLEQAIVEKAFREDLFYRLDVVRLVLPPLRQRREDIPVLAGYLIKKMAAEAGCAVKGISSDCLDIMTGYDWPGNIRELANTLEQALAICDGDEITAAHLPDKIKYWRRRGTSGEKPGTGPPAPLGFGRDYSGFVEMLKFFACEFAWEELFAEQIIEAGSLVASLSERLERAMMRRNIKEEKLPSLQDTELKLINKALCYYDNKISLAAKALGVSRSTLYRKIKEYGLYRPEKDECPA